SVAAHAVRATLTPDAMQAAAGRIGLTIPAGNEGGGVVVAAGTSDAAQALLGKVVGIRGGAMYAQYRCIAAQHCLVLPDGTATLGFDATGGGELTSHILAAMEAAATHSATAFNRYGSTVQKQVYVYGSLEAGPTVLHRTYGMAWGVGGWLLNHFLRRISPETAARLKHRVAAEITTTFASHYTKVVSLAGALEPEAIAQYSK